EAEEYIAVRHRKVRSDLKCLIVARPRFLQLPEILEGIAQVIVRLYIFRADRQRSPITIQSFFKSSEILKSIAQAKVCLCDSGLELECPPITRQCILELPKIR